MSALRALKRRRLDDTGNHQDASQSSPPASTNGTHASPTTDRRDGRLSQSSPTANGTATPKPATSSRNLWQQAKAKAHADAVARRAQSNRKEMAVYDDIEGANAGTEKRAVGRKTAQKNGQSESGESISRRKSLEPSRNQKTQQGASPARKSLDPLRNQNPQENDSPTKRKSLDPLRNQKAQESADFSPRKSSSSLGFFKQFHAPKATETNGAEASQKNTSTKEEEPPQSAAKNWFYGKPKKTLEDEIRELRESAKKKAADDGSEDELALEDTNRRSSTRQPSQRSSVDRAKIVQEAAASPSNRTSKPPGRRKPEQPKPFLMEDLVHLDSDSQRSQLEIADSEDEMPTKALETLPSARDVRLSTPKKIASRAPKTTVSKSSKPFDKDHLRCIQQIVLEKAARRRAIPLTNLDDEYTKVYTVIHQTITAGESNSMLLIGSRGSGKSTLIEQILSEETAKHADDFHAVRLNGFIHTDDKIALREIWRQLGKEMELDEDEGTSKNYADTMSKLLALLSHPGEAETEEPGQLTKSVIFILDEFELFASHPRQTLLYNLFDIAQSRKAPIAVLGLTTRIDVAESLEKRVKSRFSHRYVHLSMPKSLQAYEQICTAALSITGKELRPDEKETLSKSPTGKTSMSDEPGVSLIWNTLVDEILKSEPCSDFIRRLYYTTKSVHDFFASLSIAVSNMPIDSTTTAATLLDHFTTALSHPLMQPPDSKMNLLHSLSIIQLALLISAARLTNIYNTEVITFALVYEEYRQLAAKAKLQASASGALAQGAGSRIWGKGVAKGAWEELVECRLIMEEGRSGGSGRVDVGLEEIGMSGVELGQWGRWCKEI